MGNMTHEERLFLLAGVFLGASLAFALFATGIFETVENHESTFIRGESASMPVKKEIVLAESATPAASVAPEVD
jgi:uncharacterized membrane protein YqhA